MAVAPANSPQPTDKLSGLIDRVTYFNEESGFAVLKVKVGGYRDLVTVVGSLPAANAGEWLTAEGAWVRDREHGLQLKATVLKTVPPDTAEGIQKYLGSGMVKGIGPVFAKRILERFGTDILSVIEHRSGELETVEGIGPKRRLRPAGLGGGQAGPGNHAVPLRPRSQHQQSRPDLQDVWQSGDWEGQEQSLRAGQRHLRHRLQDRRPDRPERRHPQGFARKSQRGHRSRPARGHYGGPLRLARSSTDRFRRQAAGGWRRDSGASTVPDDYLRLSVAGNDPRRVLGLLASSAESGRRYCSEDPGVGLLASSAESGRRYCSEDPGVGSDAAGIPAHRFRKGGAVVRGKDGQDTGPKPEGRP